MGPGRQVALGRLALGASAAVGLALLLRRAADRVVEARPHVPGPDGLVEATPAGLARAAGADLDVYVLASMMESEEGTDKGRLAVGRAALNAARGRREKIVPLLIPSGRLGRQGPNPYAATSRPPTSRTLALAAAVLEGRVPDLVDRAYLWDAPAAQDRLHALYLKDPDRYPKYRYGSAEVAARRRAAGLCEVRVPGVPRTRFWARVT